MHKKLIFSPLVLALFFLCNGCKIYNFSGANIPPDVKTVSVENFVNESGLGPARLAQIFSEKLRDYMQTNSTLRGVKNNGDLQFEGSIVGFVVGPAAPTGTEISALNRLTIRLKVKFTNTKTEAQSFEKEFSFFADYNQTESLASVENRLVDEISTQIVFDIFNAALSNW